MKRVRRKQRNRVLALVLSVAVVMSPMTLPGQTVYAADGKINLSAYIDMAGTLDAVDGTNGNTPAAELLVELPADMDEKQELDALGVKQLVVDFKVNTMTAYAGERTGCMAFGMSKAYSWKNGEWVNIAAGESATAKFDLASMDWNGYDRIGKLGLQFANLASGSSVSYEISDIYFTTDASGDSGSSSSQITTDREDSGNVVATVNAQGQPSNDWSGFELSVDNQTGKSICDWVITMTVPSGSAAKFKCWNATFTADGDTIYLYPNKENSNAVLGTGKMSANPPGFGFSSTWVNASDITITNVAYNYGTQSTIDYSKGDTNDETGGSGSSGGSAQKDTTTDLNLDISYNFAKLLQESLYFYDGNMCGTGVDENSAFSWRGNCHTYDSYVTYNGKTVDVSGGYHDAGDHVKFGLPQGYAATVLALGYYQFADAYDELGQTAHFNTIMDYFCDYFTRCTIYKEGTDTVEAFCYQVGDGDSDHAKWETPEGQTIGRPAFFATTSNPATDEVSVAVAALALQAANYQKQGGAEALAKSKAYLKTAEDLFDFAKNCSNKQVATQGAAPFYSSNNWEDDYCTAAAALYAATGNESYKQQRDAYYGKLNTGWCLTWDNTWPVAAVLKDDYTAVSAFASYGSKNTAQGFKMINGWGSARYNASAQFMGLIYDQANQKLSMADGNYSSWATGQMKYLLGNNKAKRCFVVGYNENAAKYPHHRAASRSNDAGQVREDHYTLLGALVGGPSDEYDTYADNQADYNCNEVALDYNAGLVGAAAGLYLLHKGEEAYPADLATEAELESIGVEKYYGTSSSGSEDPNPSPSPTPSETPSPSPVPSETPSPSPTPSESPSPSPSPTPSESPSPSPSETPSPSPTPSETPSPSPTPSETPRPSPVPSESPSPSPTPSESQSPSPTPSESSSPSPTPSETPSPSPTPSESPSPSPAPSESPSPTPSETPSQKPSETPSPTPSETPSPSSTPSETPSPSPTPSETPSQQPSESPSATPGQQPSETPEDDVDETPEDDVDETPDEAVEVGDSMDISGQVYEITQIEDGKVYVTFTEADEDAEDITIPTTFTDAAGRTCYVKEIAPYAFANHKKLKKVKIAEGITKIGKKAFYHCTALKKVTLPGSLVSIGDSVFEGDRSITAITIPKNVKTIGKKAFYKCKKLKTVTLKTTKMKKVGASALKKTKKGMLFKLPKKKNAAYRKLLKKKYDSGVRFRKIK